MNIWFTALTAGNGVALLVLFVLFDRRTKTLVYVCTRWLGGSNQLANDDSLGASSRIRVRFAEEGASFYEDKSLTLWHFQVVGYPPVSMAQLPVRLHASLSLPESIALFGAQPCYFFAKAALSGQPGDWFEHFRKYILTLDGAIWRRTTRSFVAFQDHTCVVRLVALRYAATAFQHELLLPDNRAVRRIVAALQARDLALLLDDGLYDFETNHGLITAIGLLHFALDVPDAGRRIIVSKVAYWMRSSEDYFISDDGVPLEVSPSYWKLIYQLFLEIEELLKIFGEQVSFRKLNQVKKFFQNYSIDNRVNRFGDSALDHDLQLADSPKQPVDGVTVRIFDTGLFVADFAAGGRVLAQLVLNSQNIQPWIHGQESQMAMGFFSDDIFWVDSPGRYTSGKKGTKARIDNFRNQSVPVRQDSGYVPGWRYVGVKQTPDSATFSFTLTHLGQALLSRKVTVSCNGSFTLHDIAPGGVVEARFLLPAQADASFENGVLTVDVSGRQVVFDFKGRPLFEDGLISFERNVALSTKIFSLTGAEVKLGWTSRCSFSGSLLVEVSASLPYTKRQVLSRNQPGNWLQKVSVKKLLVAVTVVMIFDVVLTVI